VQQALPGIQLFPLAGDYAQYLALLGQYADQHRTQIHAYVLLPSEVHLVATPSESTSLSLMMQGLGRKFVADYNRLHQRAGTLWRGRFRAAPFEAKRYLVHFMRYVEQLPVGRGLVAEPLDYTWSSARHHAGRDLSPLVVEHSAFWQLGNTPFEREAAYRRLLEGRLTQAEVLLCERGAATGWPVGSVEFLKAAEAVAGRSVTRQPAGRPRQKVQND
jgi:putative transposase